MLFWRNTKPFGPPSPFSTNPPPISEQFFWVLLKKIFLLYGKLGVPLTFKVIGLTRYRQECKGVIIDRMLSSSVSGSVQARLMLIFKKVFQGKVFHFADEYRIENSFVWRRKLDRQTPLIFEFYSYECIFLCMDFLITRWLILNIYRR